MLIAEKNRNQYKLSPRSVMKRKLIWLHLTFTRKLAKKIHKLYVCLAYLLGKLSTLKTEELECLHNFLYRGRFASPLDKFKMNCS